MQLLECSGWFLQYAFAYWTKSTDSTFIIFWSIDMSRDLLSIEVCGIFHLFYCLPGEMCKFDH